ncbi:MAG: 16S rRNA (cytidine(1402)-2'-O)-methyltransferase [Campylobacterales bacterium]
MLSFVPTPIGNLDDITVRSLKVLGAARTIFCEDTRVTRKLLTLLSERHGLVISEPKFISLHAHNEGYLLKNLDPAIFNEPAVYLSDAGMPGISDPGAALVRYCLAHDIAFEVLPGPSALLPAFVMAGFEEHRFVFGGFLPHKGKERAKQLDELLEMGLPLVLYEAPHRIEQLALELAQKVPHREVVLVKELTKFHEQRFSLKAEELPQFLKGGISFKGEWVVIINGGTTKGKLVLDRQMIDELQLPPKQKAKLIAQLEGRSIKECYNSLAQATSAVER